MARGSCLQSTVVLFLVLTALFVAHNVVIRMLRGKAGMFAALTSYRELG